MGRKWVGKGKNCLSRAISPFPTVFSNNLYCRHVKTRACLGKGKKKKIGFFIKYELAPQVKTEAFVGSIDQNQTAQNELSDL